jgi:phenylpropionate dioxygenase-like ring-hydroxylating dioxygenase large terminal subunit
MTTTGDELVQVDVTGFGLARPTKVPKERYTSDAFAALELERLWPRVWQIACSVDHVAAAGDWYEYRVGPYSVIVVRGDDDGLRAFQNVCRHRGNSLCQGAGGGLSELRCPFHRWAWDLRGRLREVPNRKAFGPGLRNDDFPLLPVAVDTWGPLVFVNMDLDAEPLATYLEGVPGDTAWARLDEFRCQVTATMPVECNWKVVADGFSETYHVQGIHPEMLGSIDDVDAPQRVWGRQAVSYQRYGVASPRLGRHVDDRAVWDSFVATQPDRLGVKRGEAAPAPAVGDGQTMADAIAARIRSHQATFGVELGEFDTAQMLDLAQYNLFPNATVLVWADEVNVITSRPGMATDRAEMTLSIFHRKPSAATPRKRPRDLAIAPDGDLGFVFNQDVAMLKTAQLGLRQPGLTHIVLSGEECRIVNMHRNLERQLGIEPSQLSPVGE